MSEEKGCEIPKGHPFPHNGMTFYLPVVDLIREFDALALKLKDEGKTHYDYLDEVQKTLQERFGMVLNLDQTDYVSDELQKVQFLKKKQRRSVFDQPQT